MKQRHGWRWTSLAGSLLVCVNACRHQSATSIEPVCLESGSFRGMIIAVAPGLNHSGQRSVDMVQLADIMAAELMYVEGITVLPVNRTLAILAAQGTATVTSAEHALEVAGLMGADGILVFSITEYDPYDPPRMGITAQLYGHRPGTRYAIGASPDADSTATGDRTTATGPLAHTQRLFDASHARVADEVRRFARHRMAGDSPYGWRRYMVSQRDYFRFCSFATLRALFTGDFRVASALVRADQEGMP